MPSVKYTYTISSTCPHGVNIDALSYEIRASVIKINLHYVYVDNSDDRVDVWFRSELDSTDQAILVELLNNHKGLSLSLQTTISGSGADYSRNLIINEQAEGIGVSQEMPFHVITTTVAAPHSLYGPSHSGTLDPSQVPSGVVWYDDVNGGSLDNRYYTEAESDEKLTHLSAGSQMFLPGYNYSGGSSITVSGSIVSFFTNSYMHTPIISLSVPGATLSLVPDTTNYVIANYNNGSPILQITTDVNIIDEALLQPIYTITRFESNTDILPWYKVSTGLSNRLHARFARTDRFKRESGLNFYISSRRLNIEAGVVWYGSHRVILPAFDSTTQAMDMFTHVSGTWNVDYTNLVETNFYDDGDNIVEGGTGQYLNCWIYRYISEVTSTRGAFILGEDSYLSLFAAEREYLPTDVPNVLKRHAILLGRITFLKGATSSISVGSVFSVRFPGPASDDHNALNAIQGGENGNYYHLNSAQHLNLTGNNPVFSTISGTFYGSGAGLTGIDHGMLSGLSDNDHPQYLNTTSGDARYSLLEHIHDDRYYTETEVNVISGAINAKIITDHGNLTGLSDDDHTQYLNTTRGDARYYTQTQLNSGQLDTRYYTETEVNVISGAINAKIITDHGNLTGLSDDDHPQYHDNARGDARYLQLIGGTISQNLTIMGNLTVSGTQFVSNTEIVLVEDNIIYINNGETSSGVAEGLAGIQVDRGTAPDYLFIFNESDDTFRAGISGSTQAVATREDSPTNNYIAYWNASQYRFDTVSGLAYTDIASKNYVSSVSGSLQSQINTFKDHGNLSGLADDDHTQYHTDARGDARYYTQTQLNNGQLDSRYYTETEVNTISGNITAQLHGRSHAMTSTSDHTSGNNKVFYSNSSGQVVELALSTSGTVLVSQGTTAAPVFSNAANLLGPAGELPTCSVRVSSTVDFALTTSWQNVTFPIIDHQNNTAILERDPSNTDHILIKETGSYVIQYSAPVYCPTVERVDVRVRKNDNAVISGSESYLNDSMTQQVANQFSCSLTAGDFISWQALGSSTGDYIARDSTFSVVRLRALKGDVGPAGVDGQPGTGSTINAAKDGTTVSGSPFSRFNFQSCTISGSTTSGTVDIKPLFGSYFQDSASEGDSSTTSASWTTKTSITTPNLPSGRYRIGWHYNMYGASTAVSPTGRVIVNATDTIHLYLYEPKDASANEQDTISGFYYTTTSGVQTINLDYASEAAGSGMTMRRARLEFWRVS